MVDKLIGFYGNKPSYTPKATDQLFVEIGSNHFACLVKNTETAQLEAFEIFNFNNEKIDWNDTFFELKQLSSILGFNYSNTHIYYNFEEALMLPLIKLSANAAENYLSLVYGEDDRSQTKHDKIDLVLPFVTVYRIKQSLIEVLNLNFLLFTANHSYTKILNDLFEKEISAPLFLKLIIYYKHIIIVLVKDNQLQLVQSHYYQNADDILYFVLSAVQQNENTALQAHLEVSGMIDSQVGLLNQLKKSFGIVSFGSVSADEEFPFVSTEFPSYSLTPFFKLTV